jgi:hypothetical protein
VAPAAQAGCVLCLLTPATQAVALSNFGPGQTATGAGALTATTVLGNWTLTAQDTSGTNPGHMLSTSGTCTGSESALTDPLDVDVTSSVAGVTSAGSVALSGTVQTVASSSAILSAATLTENYSQVIPTSDTLRAGCVYSITITYTLQ